MCSLSRLRTLMLGCAVLMTLISVGSTRGQEKGSNDVEFKTSDGVTLAGKLYAGGGTGKRDATVLLIPNFSLKNGGGIAEEGYDSLAKALQKEGYTVLSFDFRGFGESTAVDKDVFWKQPHNLTNVRKRVIAGKYPEKIDHKDFTKPSYVQYFVNDIAAAKAFLDQANDNKKCNSSNVVVIGAGYGATLGAMWIANECRRRKDLAILGGPPMLGDIEGKDITGAVWLSLSPTLPGGAVPLTKWIAEAGKTHKIPMAFIHGKNDGTSATVAQKMSAAIRGKEGNKDDKDDKDKFGKKTHFAYTGAKEIADTKLVGNKLLQSALGTENWIIKGYLNKLMDDRPVKLPTERKIEMSRFYYARPNGAPLKINKLHGVKVPSVDVPLMMFP